MKDTIPLRDELLEAALPHIMFDGWTRRALAAAASDLGRDPLEISRAFPGGMNDVVEHFSDLADRWMLDDLSSQNLRDLPIHEGVALAVHLRLERLIPYREAVRRALAFLALPGHQVMAARCTYRTVDVIWRAVGDRSTDFNFYTKRALLAGVYASTVVYWLGDDSENFEFTSRFIDRRIADVAGAIKARRRMTKSISGIFSGLRPRRHVFER